MTDRLLQTIIVCPKCRAARLASNRSLPGIRGFQAMPGAEFRRLTIDPGGNIQPEGGVEKWLGVLNPKPVIFSKRDPPGFQRHSRRDRPWNPSRGF